MPTKNRMIGKLNRQYRGDYPIDRIGERRKQLTVIYPGGRNPVNNKIYWVVRCDCGVVKTISEHSFKKSQSCGCALATPRTKALTAGYKSGLLTLTKMERVGNLRYWHCQCECGNEAFTREDGLRNQFVLSCGCYNKIATGARAKTHGLSRTRLFNIHDNMVRRCHFLKEGLWDYKHYQGRGIQVCQEWLDDAPQGFLAFHKWALENGYSDNLTLDRIDVNGNYEPSNCRWATQKEQCRNTRRTLKITVNGEEMSLQDACEKYKCPVKAVAVVRRLALGWEPLEALTTSPYVRRKP